MKQRIGRLAPLCFSVGLHSLFVFLVSKTFFTAPVSFKPQSPIRATLYFPPRIENTPNTAPTKKTRLQDTKQSTQQTDDNAAVAPEVTPDILLPSLPEQVSDSADTSTKPINIREATRRALSTIRSQEMETTFEAELDEYRSRDSRIIQNAPRQVIIEGPIDNRPKTVPTDCSNRTKKTLTIISGALGGRIKCRSYSNKDINGYIDLHRNKGQTQLEQSSKND